jgi:hypothetical protein
MGSRTLSEERYEDCIFAHKKQTNTKSGKRTQLATETQLKTRANHKPWRAEGEKRRTLLKDQFTAGESLLMQWSNVDKRK